VCFLAYLYLIRKKLCKCVREKLQICMFNVHADAVSYFLCPILRIRPNMRQMKKSNWIFSGQNEAEIQTSRLGLSSFVRLRFLSSRFVFLGLLP
jgi:hypothetical protein